jgi:hypothetical protein
LQAIAGSQVDTEPFSKSGRRPSHVNRHVENLPGGHPDQLSLRALQLVVKAPQNMRPREGLVLLDEVDIKTRDLGKLLAVLGFPEVTAIVICDPAAEQEEACERHIGHQNAISGHWIRI